MNLDVSGLKFVRLEADPNGNYNKRFDDDEQLAGVYDGLDEVIYFLAPITVGTAIHELTHFYLDTVNSMSGNLDEHRTYAQAIGEAFIKQYGRDALSNYAILNLCWDKPNKWDEVVCEIVAVYGRRGQFNKIKELFNHDD